ncbi:E3 ubiquitin-protein ligase SIS3-like [Rutidosis leptorrhynchoides]|uniref:E3 ubiquitin-protein ligase SIS3-like n=1 Tax=Rutidosis leptorrhynchoides TaxID=125765 RepID=UPI003A99964C
MAIGLSWIVGLYLMILAYLIFQSAGNGKDYDRCKLPIHTWRVVDYTLVFIFCLLMIVDYFIVASIGLDNGRQLTGKRFIARVVVVCVTYALLYPFLWVSTVVGAIWFATEWECLTGNQMCSIVEWLLYTFGALIYIACIFGRKWLKRRRFHLRHPSPGIRVSEFKVFVSMIRQPNDLAYEAFVRATIRNQQIQMFESMAELIRGLPMYTLREIPTDCSDCPICLKEFRINQKVRGLPCAHIFHKKCIATWLRVNMSCPQCRCVAFPRNNASSVPGGAEQSADSASQSVRSQPYSASYVIRMQSYLVPVHTGDPQPN